jgi:hypothetical protein
MAFKRSAVRFRLAPPTFARLALVIRGKAAKVARHSPQGEGGLDQLEFRSMKYVYFLQSIAHPDPNYVGLIDDLKARLKSTTPAARHTHQNTSPKTQALAAGDLRRIF